MSTKCLNIKKTTVFFNTGIHIKEKENGTNLSQPMLHDKTELKEYLISVAESTCHDMNILTAIGNEGANSLLASTLWFQEVVFASLSLSSSSTSSFNK